MINSIVKMSIFSISSTEYVQTENYRCLVELKIEKNRKRIITKKPMTSSATLFSTRRHRYIKTKKMKSKRIETKEKNHYTQEFDSVV